MPNYDAQLIRWCNDELRIPLHVDSNAIELALSNGVAIGHVVARVATAAGISTPDSMIANLNNEDSTVAKIGNFTLLRPVLAALGIPLPRRLMDEVCTESRGAGMQVLLLLKDKYDIVTGAVKPKVALRSTFDALHPELVSTRGPRERMIVKEADKTYATKLLEAGRSVRATQQEMHLKKFEDHRLAVDALIDQEMEAKLRDAFQRTRALSEGTRKLAVTRQKWMDSFQEAEHALHDVEMDRRHDRERIDLAYELTSLERARILVNNERVLSKREALGIDGISGQEARMRRMGIDPHTSSIEKVTALKSAASEGRDGASRPAVGGVSAHTLALLAPKPIDVVAASVLANTLPGLDAATRTSSIAKLTSTGGIPPLHGSVETSLRTLSTTSTSLPSYAEGAEGPQDHMERVVASFAASFKPREVALYEENTRRKVAGTRDMRRDKATRGRLQAVVAAEQAELAARTIHDAQEVEQFRAQARIEREAAEKSLLAKTAKDARVQAGLEWAVRTEAKLDARFNERASRDRAAAEAERRVRQEAERPIAEARAKGRAAAEASARDAVSSWMRSGVTEMLVDAALAVVDGTEESIILGRQQPGLFPTEWRAIKRSFVDGSIADSRLALLKEQLRASTRGAGIAEQGQRGQGLLPWGVLLGDRVAGSDAKLGGAEAAVPGLISDRTVTLPEPARIGPAHPFALSLEVDGDARTAHLDAADYDDWSQGAGVWALPSKGSASPSAHSPVRSRRSSGSRAGAVEGVWPQASEFLQHVTMQAEVKGGAEEKADGEQVAAVAAPAARNQPSWKLDAPTQPEALLRLAALQLQHRAEMADESYVGPSLLLAEPTVVLIAKRDASGESPLSVLAAAAVQTALASRLSARMRLLHIQPVDILLAAVSVFDVENASLRAQAESIGTLASQFPSVAALGGGSLHACMEAWTKDTNATKVRPDHFAYASPQEAAEATALWYELGAVVALSHASLLQVMSVAPGCAGTSGDGALLSPLLPLPVFPQGSMRSVTESVVMGATECTIPADIMDAAQAIASAREKVRAAIAAAAGEPPTMGKDAKSRPGTAKKDEKEKDKKGAPAGKGGKEVPIAMKAEDLPSVQSIELFPGAKLMQSALFARALSLYLVHAQRVVDRARLSDVVGLSGFGGLLLDGVPSCPEHVVAIEYALRGEVVWASPANPENRLAGEEDLPAFSRPASAAAPRPSMSSSALIPTGYIPSPYMPLEWDLTLVSLLSAMSSGTWTLPAVGQAAHNAWGAAVAEEAARKEAEAAGKLGAEEPVASPGLAQGGSKKGAPAPRPASSAKTKGAPVPEAAAPRGAGPRPPASTSVQAVLVLDPSWCARISPNDERSEGLAVDVFTGAVVSLHMPLLALHPPATEAALESTPAATAKSAPNKPVAQGKGSVKGPVDDTPPLVAALKRVPQNLRVVCTDERVLAAAAEVTMLGASCVAGWHALAPAAATLHFGGQADPVKTEADGRSLASIRSSAGLIEVHLEHALTSFQGSVPQLDGESTGTTSYLLPLLAAAARGILPDMVRLQAVVHAYNTCADSRVDVVSHALRALRALQSHARGKIRRIARGLLRLLRGTPDDSVPARLAPTFTIVTRSVRDIEQAIMKTRARVMEERAIRVRMQHVKKKNAEESKQGLNGVQDGTLLPKVSTLRSTKHVVGGVIVTEQGETNQAFLQVADEICTLETPESGQDVALVESLCAKASDAGVQLWQCVEERKEKAKVLLSDLGEDGWIEDVNGAVLALAALLVQCDLRSLEDDLTFCSATVSMCTSDIHSSYRHLLASVQVVVTPNARGVCPAQSAWAWEEAADCTKEDPQVGSPTVSLEVPAHIEALLSGQRVAEYGACAAWAVGQEGKVWESRAAEASPFQAAATGTLLSGTCNRIVRTCLTCARMSASLRRSHEDMLQWCDATLLAWTRARNSAIMSTVHGLQGVLRASADPEAYRIAVANADRQARMEGGSGMEGGGLSSLMLGPDTSGRGTVPRGTARAVVNATRTGRRLPPPHAQAQSKASDPDDLGGTILAADVPVPRLSPLSFIVPQSDGVHELYGSLQMWEKPGVSLVGGTPHQLAYPDDASHAVRPGVAIATSLAGAMNVAVQAMAVLEGSAPLHEMGSLAATVSIRPIIFNGAGNKVQGAGAKRTGPGMQSPSLEPPHALSLSLGLEEALSINQRITGRGIQAIASAFIEGLQEHRVCSGRGASREHNRLLSLDSMWREGGAGVLHSTADDGSGLITCAQAIQGAVLSAAEKLTPTQPSRGAMQQDIPSSWLQAPAGVWLHFARQFGSAATTSEGMRTTDSTVWDKRAARRFVLALIFSRVRALPTLEQLLLQRRNLMFADVDGNGVLTQHEYVGACMWFETAPSRAAAVVREQDRETATVLASRLGKGPALDLKRKHRVAHTVLDGRVAPEAAWVQGGERDVDVALRENLVATSQASRLADCDGMKEALWLLYSSVPSDHPDADPSDSDSRSRASTAISLGADFHRRGFVPDEPERMDVFALALDLCSDPCSVTPRYAGTVDDGRSLSHAALLHSLMPTTVGTPLPPRACVAGQLSTPCNALPAPHSMRGGQGGAGHGGVSPTSSSGGRNEASFARRQSAYDVNEEAGSGASNGHMNSPRSHTGSTATSSPRWPGLLRAWLVASDAEAALAAKRAARRLPLPREIAAGVLPPPHNIPALENAVDKLSNSGAHALDPCAVRLSVRGARDVLHAAGLPFALIEACGLEESERYSEESEDEGITGADGEEAAAGAQEVSLATVIHRLQTAASGGVEWSRMLRVAPFSVPTSPCDAIMPGQYL